jgi:hypothetical protein
MNNWKSLLRGDPTAWLMESENPSVRYFTLKDILDRSEEDTEVRNARQEIMRAGTVYDILTKQQEPEYHQTFSRFYTNKYEGLVWQLIVLAELGAVADAQIKEQCEYMLSSSQEREDGGFSMHEAAKTGGGRKTEVIPCLTGNMVWSLIKLGYLDDPRLLKGIDWITRSMRFNDGIEQNPQIEPYNRYEMCWGKHTCHMGVVKTLKALSAIPEVRRTVEINETIQRSVEFLLVHHIFKRSHALEKISKPGWLKFGFPLMYQTDALEILDILTGLGIHDSRMDDAIGILLKKQDETGRWKMENVYELLVPIEEKGAASKWLTLRAMRVLRRYGESVKPAVM